MFSKIKKNLYIFFWKITKGGEKGLWNIGWIHTKVRTLVYINSLYSVQRSIGDSEWINKSLFYKKIISSHLDIWYLCPHFNEHRLFHLYYNNTYEFQALVSEFQTTFTLTSRLLMLTSDSILRRCQVRAWDIWTIN